MYPKGAYVQVPLDDKSKNLATIKTAFRVNTSPALLQDVMKFIITDFQANSIQKELLEKTKCNRYHICFANSDLF